ncbi:MAG: hypothetical protein V1916_02635, partial [Patescibacteria group bacterium]
YIALIAVVIILAVTLSVAMSLSGLGVTESRRGLLQQQGGEAFAAADSCLQEAYVRLRRDPNFAAGSLNVGGSSCTITVVAAGSDRTITSTGTTGSISRRLESRITLSAGVVQVQYWKAL